MYHHQEESESEEKIAKSVSRSGLQRENKNPEFQQELQLKAKAQQNNTGLPDQLKSGIEDLSGYSLDDVKVHYNSAKPAQLNAHAYAQGNQIHLGGGQEKHLAHEAWHVVQQKQGRVKPTINVNGAQVNDNVGLEKEADVMGGKALQMKQMEGFTNESKKKSASIFSTIENIVQRKPSNISKNHLLKLDKTGVILNAEADRSDPPVSFPLNTIIALRLIDHEDVVGGHLFKREYGGLDDYSNVVTWSERSEAAFTSFENDYIEEARNGARAAGKKVTYKVKTDASFPNVGINKSDLFSGPDQPQGKPADNARHKIWSLIKKSLETVPTAVDVSLDDLPVSKSFSRDASKMLSKKVEPSAVNAQNQVQNIIDGVADARLQRALDRLDNP